MFDEPYTPVDLGVYLDPGPSQLPALGIHIDSGAARPWVRVAQGRPGQHRLDELEDLLAGDDAPRARNRGGGQARGQVAGIERRAGSGE